MGRKVALVVGNSIYDDVSLARLITPSDDVDDLTKNADGSAQAWLTGDAADNHTPTW